MKHVSFRALMGIGLFACLLMLFVIAAQGEEGKTYEGLVVCIDAGHQGEGNSTQEPRQCKNGFKQLKGSQSAFQCPQAPLW